MSRGIARNEENAQSEMKCRTEAEQNDREGDAEKTC
jgi:hypothetical protein